jgi:hypothetical protein
VVWASGCCNSNLNRDHTDKDCRGSLDVKVAVVLTGKDLELVAKGMPLGTELAWPEG